MKIRDTSFHLGQKWKTDVGKETEMKQYHVSRMVFALIVALGTGLMVYAQIPGGPKGAPMYNPATEITVKGTVEAVNQMTGRQGWGGTHLPTESETLDVHVGPSWFLSQNKVTFAKGDQIEVTGSKVKFGNANALLAREITKGDQKLTLRNAKGFPVWSRRGRS
jgi:hypothetical protein